MKLTTKIIESYNFEKRISKPDYDDVQVNYELPNGLDLSTLSICGNEPTEQDSLEGLDGFIYIETKEELDDLLSMTFEEVVEKVASENEDFDKEEWI